MNTPEPKARASGAATAGVGERRSRLETATVVAVVLAWCGITSAQPDYNRDCAPSFSDSLQFMDDYANARPLADLNLDGNVNQADFLAFAHSRARPEFRFYWQVTTLRQPNQIMDTETNLAGLPISRDCVILYQQEFPRMPIIVDAQGHHVETGFHLAMRSTDGSYTTWRSNLTTWMLEHDASFAAIAAARVPAGFFGFLCLDFEAVTPLLEISRDAAGEVGQALHWSNAVETINSPTFDPEFLALAQFTPPAGASGWADLNAAEQESLLSKGYQAISEDFFTRSLLGFKQLRPSCKISFYGLPARWFPVYDDQKREYNDRIANLWALVDILSPSFYQIMWSTNDRPASPCPEYSNSPGQNSAVFASTMEEMFRIRERYGRPEQLIIPFIWWHYHHSSGLCSPNVTLDLLVNDVNAQQQIVLPWWYGADGAAFWGFYARPNGYNPYLYLDDPVRIGNDLRTRWGPWINRIACPG